MSYENYKKQKTHSIDLFVPDNVVYVIKTSEWVDTLLTSKGLVTPKGFYSPSQLELLQWKANFYNRGLDRMDSLKLLYPDPPQSLISTKE